MIGVSRGSLAMVALLSVMCPLLAACGDSIDEPTPDGIAGSPRDPCRLLSQEDAGRILGRADVQPGAAAAEDECSFSTADGRASLVYDIENQQLFSLALNDAQRSKATVVPVPGLGDQAFFYTPRSATPEPSVVPITYLKVRKRSTYLTTLVRNGETYDLNMEKQVAQKLLSAS